MTTVAQTIAERHLRNSGAGDHEAKRGSAVEVLGNVGLFFATPFLGLAYAAIYGVVGLAVVFCYGLKAFGVSCGLING